MFVLSRMAPPQRLTSHGGDLLSGWTSALSPLPRHGFLPPASVPALGFSFPFPSLCVFVFHVGFLPGCSSLVPWPRRVDAIVFWGVVLAVYRHLFPYVRLTSLDVVLKIVNWSFVADPPTSFAKRVCCWYASCLAYSLIFALGPWV